MEGNGASLFRRDARTAGAGDCCAGLAGAAYNCRRSRSALAAAWVDRVPGLAGDVDGYAVAQTAGCHRALAGGHDHLVTVALVVAARTRPFRPRLRSTHRPLAHQCCAWPGAGGDANRVGWMGEHQLRSTGVYRFSAVSGRVDSADGC